MPEEKLLYICLYHLWRTQLSQLADISDAMKITENQKPTAKNNIKKFSQAVVGYIQYSYSHISPQMLSMKHIYFSKIWLNKSLPQNPLILASSSFIDQKSCRHERILQRSFIRLNFTNDTFVWGAMCIQMVTSIPKTVACKQ